MARNSIENKIFAFQFILDVMFATSDYRDVLNALVSLIFMCIGEQPGAIVWNKFYVSLLFWNYPSLMCVFFFVFFFNSFANDSQSTLWKKHSIIKSLKPNSTNSKCKKV